MFTLTRRRRLLATGVATLALAAHALTPAHAETYPGHTTSRYLLLQGTTADVAQAAAAGCAQARTGRDGVRVLFFGTQEKNGRLRHPGTAASSATDRVPARHALKVARAWAEAFADCRAGSASAHLALGVNNKSDGGVGGAAAGRAWARIVETAAKRAGNTVVRVTGAVDAEPSWSTPAWARSWVKAFTSTTDRRLYAANSADGCPTTPTATACNNGWTVADVHYVATGAAPTIAALPQIYRTDGIQARQWAAISAWGARNGEGPLRFAGAMSQHRACAQRGGCDRTDNTPRAAWTQLRAALNADPQTRVEHLPTATDVRWP